MKILCVIPARIGSTRLPRKMLATIKGEPIINMTYKAASSCADIDKVIVATDSTEIKEVVEKTGAEVIMTPENINTGSDRVAFAAKEFPDYNIIINLQGDEPFMKAEMLSQLVQPFKTNNPPKMATLGFKLDFDTEYTNPNIVKIIIDKNNDALYFSRSPIPYFRQDIKSISNINMLHHIGLYAYDRDFLLEFTKWEQTPLEQAESLEQLRALENGIKIRVTETQYKTLEINNAEELKLAQSFSQNYEHFAAEIPFGSDAK